MQVEAVLRTLRTIVDRQGSQVNAARFLGISPQYLSDILRQHREPSCRVLETIGFERVVSYRRTK